MKEQTVVRRHVVVEGSPSLAFTVFVERFDAIKPREHNLLAQPIVETVLEPRVGGRIVDRAGDGSECAWARVLAYEPPHRIMFTWDISPTWQLEQDLANTSEVEVRFTAVDATAVDEQRTRVDLEHRHLDRHSTGWESLRDGVDDDQGWALYLARYAAEVAV